MDIKSPIKYHPDDGSIILDLLVMEHVFGYQVQWIKPDWYPLPVATLYHQDFPGIMQYSWDGNACNAMMYRNQNDVSLGSAEPVPRCSSYDNVVQHDHWLINPFTIIQTMKEKHGHEFWCITTCTIYQPFVYDASFYVPPSHGAPMDTDSALGKNRIGHARTLPLAISLAAIKALLFPDEWGPHIFEADEKHANKDASWGMVGGKPDASR